MTSQTVVDRSKVRIMGRGALIVLEGCDRAGKSTQAKMLVQSLRQLNIPTEARQFPNRNTEIGAVISQYLTCKKDLPPETVHLLFSANRWECSQEIKEMLEKGTTIVLDRYAASGAAYGAANTSKELSWCKEPDRGLPAPDLVAYLQIDNKTQEARNGWAGERFEHKEFQAKVAENFLKLTDKTWRIIERDDVNTTHSLLLEAATNIIRDVSNRPLKLLYESK